MNDHEGCSRNAAAWLWGVFFFVCIAAAAASLIRGPGPLGVRVLVGVVLASLLVIMLTGALNRPTES